MTQLKLPLQKQIVFTASPFDRQSAKRKDPDWLLARRADPDSLFLPMRELKALINLSDGSGPRLDWRPATEMADEFFFIFLGTWNERCYFAADIGSDRPREGWGKFIDVRSIAAELSDPEAGIVAQARSIIDWHARHRFCAVCGAETKSDDGGYVRRCQNPSCKAEHFPRTDPVAIMMVYRKDACLLGRQPRFVPGVYSALAGFLEPGETIEAAVRREIAEEAGISIGQVDYVASQPWPFPSSLMIGCFAEALSEEIVIDKDELEDARWFSRDEVVLMLERSLTTTAPRMPPPLSLAHQLARAWVKG